MSTKRNRVKKYGEVFTPEWVVKMMCDMLEQNSPGAFQKQKTFLEPACGNGNFLVEILSRKLDHCDTEADCLIALKSIYGIDLLPDNVEKAKARMLDMFVDCCGMEEQALEILNKNIICANALENMCPWDKD